MLKTGRTFAGFYTDGTTLEQGTPSTNVAPVVSGLWDQWVQVDLTITMTEAGAADVIDVSAALTFPNGNQETVTFTRNGNLGTLNFGTFMLAPSAVGPFATHTCDVHFDDWWMATATKGDVATMPAFPVGTRICRAHITGQGSEDDWTNDWPKFPSSIGLVVGDTQTATGVGLRTTFTHQLAADLGITGSVYGISLRPEVSSSITQVGKYRLGGVTYDNAGQNFGTIVGEVYFALMTTLSTAAFDAIQWGLECNHATAIQRLYAMNAEVLHDGLAKPPIYLNLGAGYRHKWVKYTGDGTTGKAVTGAGFRPTFVKVLPYNTGQETHIRSVAIPFTQSQDAGIRLAKEIVSMDADGFTLGAGLTNTAGQTYVALCVRDDGLADGANYIFHFRQGSICSNNWIEVFSHSVACLLKVLFLVPSNTASGPTGYFKTADMGTLLAPLDANTPAAAVTLDANGWSLGTVASVHNTTDIGCFYGWADTDQVDLFCAVGEIPPSSVDVVVPVVFTDPLYLAFGRGNNATAGGVRLNEAIYSGANCSRWVSGTINQASKLIALDNTSFTVDGTAGAMLTASVECWWFAMAGAGQVLPSTEITTIPVGTSIGLIWVEAFLPT